MDNGHNAASSPSGSDELQFGSILRTITMQIHVQSVWAMTKSEPNMEDRNYM